MYVPRPEPNSPIRLADKNQMNNPSRHSTIFKKRWLSDGLPAHMIPSTRESLENVIYTYTSHTKSMVWLTFFPAPGRQPVKRSRHQIHGAKQEKLYPEEEGSQYKYKLKNPRMGGDHVCWKSVIEPSFFEDGATAGWIVRVISIC